MDLGASGSRMIVANYFVFKCLNKSILFLHSSTADYYIRSKGSDLYMKMALDPQELLPKVYSSLQAVESTFINS